MLSVAEEETRALAAQLLDRTAYDPPEAAPGRVRDARLVAKGALELAAALEAARSGEEAALAHWRRCVEIIGKAAYDACDEAVAERERAAP